MNENNWETLYDKIAEAVETRQTSWADNKTSWAWWLNHDEMLRVMPDGTVLFHPRKNSELSLPIASPRLLEILSRRYPLLPKISIDEAFSVLDKALSEERL